MLQRVLKQLNKYGIGHGLWSCLDIDEEHCALFLRQANKKEHRLSVKKDEFKSAIFKILESLGFETKNCVNSKFNVFPALENTQEYLFVYDNKDFSVILISQTNGEELDREIEDLIKKIEESKWWNKINVAKS